MVIFLLATHLTCWVSSDTRTQHLLKPYHPFPQIQTTCCDSFLACGELRFSFSPKCENTHYTHTCTHAHRSVISFCLLHGLLSCSCITGRGWELWGTMSRHLTSLAWPCVSTPGRPEGSPRSAAECHLHPQPKIAAWFSAYTRREHEEGVTPILCYFEMKKKKIIIIIHNRCLHRTSNSF